MIVELHEMPPGTTAQAFVGPVDPTDRSSDAGEHRVRVDFFGPDGRALDTHGLAVQGRARAHDAAGAMRRRCEAAGIGWRASG